MIRTICLACLVLTLAACSNSGYRSGYRGVNSSNDNPDCPRSGDPFEMFCRR